MGLGLAIARELAAEGAHVVGVDLKEHSIGDLSLQVDITDEQPTPVDYELARNVEASIARIAAENPRARIVLAHSDEEATEKAATYDPHWKLDVLLKAIRNPPQKGETIDLSADWLKANLIGRVGWAKLTVTEDEYKGKKIKKNECAIF